MKDILLIIPAYNEEDNICRVVRNIINNYNDFDYVVVNDGSQDNTAKICKENKYNLINLPINVGLAGAIQTGMKYAYREGYAFAVQIDADGQHRPEYICDMLMEAKKGKDIVIGSRFLNNKKPFSLRMLGSRLISVAITITTGKKITDPTSGMRLFDKAMIEEFANNMNYGPEPDTVSFLIKNGAKMSEVPVEMDERIAGDSYLSFGKSCLYMARMLTSILVIQNFRNRKV